jgi:hypothetical protein
MIPWIESLAGSQATRREKMTAGQSRGIWLVDVTSEKGKLLKLVLRLDMGSSPLSGSELSFEREASVYSALKNTDMRIPRFFGKTQSGDAILLERVDGTADLSKIPDKQVFGEVRHDFIVCGGTQKLDNVLSSMSHT